MVILLPRPRVKVAHILKKISILITKFTRTPSAATALKKLNHNKTKITDAEKIIINWKKNEINFLKVKWLIRIGGPGEGENPKWLGSHGR